MFTGIIQAVGYLAKREVTGVDARLYLHTGKLELREVQIGDSIAVNGVCLTAVALTGDGFWADASVETLKLSTLGQLQQGDRVNLEKALTLQTPLGGHLVSGHVDGIGQLQERYADGRSVRLTFEAPAALAKYIAAKGSICIDGISLTVNSVNGALFSLNIVPHTLAMTTLVDLSIGGQVNLEVDVVARYLERLLLGEQAAHTQPKPSTLDEGFLAKHGFL